MAANEPIMLKDKHGQGIPALGPYHANTQSVNITDDTAQTLVFPTGTMYYELASVIPLYVDADGTADVNSAVFPAGAAIYKVMTGQTQVSVKRVTTDTGPVTLTPMG